MASTYTNGDWAALIAQTESAVAEYTSSSATSAATSATPAVGSRAFSKTIDHTLLKLDAQPAQFDDLCAEARANDFATVCVRPEWVEKCVAALHGSDVHVASVIGFHEGTYDLAHKLLETTESLRAGASELDIVLNYPSLQTGDSYTAIYNELAALRSAAEPPAQLKLILETSQLTHSQIVAACVLAAAAQFDFVKTSTGFNGRGASVEDVRLMAACCSCLAREAAIGGSAVMRVKASGGVRSLKDAVTMLEAGAGRLGTSAGVAIARQAKEAADGNHVLRGTPAGVEVEASSDY